MANAEVKTTLSYSVRNMGNIQTGEKVKRPVPISNDSIGLDRFSEEMAEDDGLMAGKATHIKGFISSMFVKVKDILRQGNTVTLDDYVRFTPTFRGPVDPDTGKPNNETVLSVAIRPLKKLKLDIKDFTLVNRAGESAIPKITSITANAEGDVLDKIIKGTTFTMNGRNLYYNADMGDTITISYTSDGESQSLTIIPNGGSNFVRTFSFPEGLSSLADNTELTITLRTRMGIEEGAFSSASRKAVLISR